jgi:hypothetical protein
MAIVSRFPQFIILPYLLSCSLCHLIDKGYKRFSKRNVVIGLLVFLLIVLLAEFLVPGFGTLTFGQCSYDTDLISQCSLACIELDWKHSDMATAEALAVATFCNYRPAGIETCDQILESCLFRLTNGTIIIISEGCALSFG